MAQRQIRLLECLMFVCLFVLTNSTSAQQSPYKNLTTPISTAVYDTILGMNLDVNKVSPMAKHGDVSITVLTVGGGGNPFVFEMQYIPDGGFIGVDSFVLEFKTPGFYPYQVYRGYRISVTPSFVSAVEDYAVTTLNTPVTINPLANDIAPWGPLNISGIPLSNNGTATISGNQIVFTPDPGFLGVAHLNYTICDALNTCQTSSIHIGVNEGLPPNDVLKVFTKRNQPLRVPLTYDAYTVSQQASIGTVTVPDGKSFRYVPEDGIAGNDTFILKTVVNGTDYFREVQVTVFDVSGPNMMAIDDIKYTPKDRPITFNVRKNDIGNLLVRSWSIPSNFPGTISGTNTIGNVTFTPNPGFSGVATFTYFLGTSSYPALEMGTVSIVVNNLALPALKLPYILTTPKETPMVLHYDIAYDDFSFVIPDQPQNGSVQYLPGMTSQVINGQTVSGNNLLIYTPQAGFTGMADFPLIFCAPNGECEVTKIIVEVVDVTAGSTPFCLTECAWPGDANADGLVNNKDLLLMGYTLGLDGSSRIDGSTEWYPQYSDDWNNPFDDLPKDQKHLDANGNGYLDSDDIGVIGQNYNRAHNLVPKTVPTGKGLPFSIQLLTPNPGIGDLVQIQVSLGNQYFPATDIYGFTFDMMLAPGVIDSAFKMTYLDNTWLNLNSSSVKLSARPAVGRFETAFSRAGGKPASGFGTIGVLEFIIIDIIEGGKPEDGISFTLYPTITLTDGSTSTGEPIILEIPINAKDRSISAATNRSRQLSAFPSPAKDILHVSWEGNDDIKALTLSDVHGKTLCEQKNVAAAQTQLNISSLPTGFYILSAQTESTVVSKKVQVVR